jgi:hypothetical protein
MISFTRPADAGLLRPAPISAPLRRLQSTVAASGPLLQEIQDRFAHPERRVYHDVAAFLIGTDHD